ncbi:DUF4190 domain-containing protein [Microbacterium marinilacus]|uniref:DUF4190 domain-containing protein n=1 Tax=Microbacterium marinilacus TaxID=415209 RepID=A0ABP7BG07_9MICO|nr:DUF4190 domain-containing protein [Microbacterium marinilacus]MBY0690173.1 DUF4190 domain-containing protein [Microbacterium marinilacus]
MSTPTPDQPPLQGAPYPPPPAYPTVNVYGYPPPPRTNGLAVTSMVIGLAAVFSAAVAWVPVIGWFTPLFPLAAVILGHIAVVQINRRGEGGKGMAITGLVLGYVLIAVNLAIIGLIAAVVGTFVGTAVNLS